MVWLPRYLATASSSSSSSYSSYTKMEQHCFFLVIVIIQIFSTAVCCIGVTRLIHSISIPTVGNWILISCYQVDRISDLKKLKSININSTNNIIINVIEFLGNVGDGWGITSISAKRVFFFVEKIAVGRCLLCFSIGYGTRIVDNNDILNGQGRVGEGRKRGLVTCLRCIFLIDNGTIASSKRV